MVNPKGPFGGIDGGWPQDPQGLHPTAESSKWGPEALKHTNDVQVQRIQQRF